MWRRLIPALLAALALAAPLRAQEVAPHAIDIPAWFSESFLEFGDEAREAAKSGKRVMIYFGQDGCPYCRLLMQTNFTQRALADKARRGLVSIALNLWGDREVLWVDGRRLSEKELALALKVQFTPTLLFLGEDGQVVVRINGYQPPHRLEAVLDYVINREEKRQSLTDYMKTAVREAASEALHEETFLLRPPYRFDRRAGGRPLVVLFETPHCAGCDELHREGFRRPEVLELLARFDVARFSLFDRSELTTPAGKRISAEQWARELGIAYTPTLVFFDTAGREVFRIDAYLRPFHLASSLDYVASGAYLKEPSFQRYIQARADARRAKGEKIELMK